MSWVKLEAFRFREGKSERKQAKVKVKLSLEQATKVQRGSKGTTLFFI
jgi:hypothetical protein